MRSIAHAMFWEYFIRIRVSFIFFLALSILAFAAPVAILQATHFDQNSPDFVFMYLVFSGLGLICITLAVAGFQSPAFRYYTLPISTTRLVAWKLFVPSTIAAMTVAIILTCVNYGYSMDLPFLGLSLFAFAATGPIALLILLLPSQPLLNMVGVIAIETALVYWLRSRHGDLFSKPTRFWTSVTPGEFLTLLAFVAITYWVGLRNAAAGRCGEHINWKGSTKWLERFRTILMSRSDVSLPPFQSKAQAQFWSEYRQAGSAIPATTAMIAGIALLPLPFYIYAQQLQGKLDPTFKTEIISEVYFGFYVFGLVFPFIGFIAGCIFASLDLSGVKHSQESPSLGELINGSEIAKSIQMGPFRATLPIRPIDFAAAILRTIIQSGLLAWSVWAILFLCFLGLTEIAFPNELSLVEINKPNIGYWYVPLTLVGSWIMIANVGSLTLTGRGGFVMLSFLAAGLLIFASIFIDKFDSAMVDNVVYALLSFLSLAIVTATVYAFKTASRGKLIRYSYAITGGVIALTILCLAIVLAPFALFPTAYLMIAAFAALVVLPMASFPLAIAWNRHR